MGNIIQADLKRNLIAERPEYFSKSFACEIRVVMIYSLIVIPISFPDCPFHEKGILILDNTKSISCKFIIISQRITDIKMDPEKFTFHLPYSGRF